MLLGRKVAGHDHDPTFDTEVDLELAQSWMVGHGLNQVPLGVLGGTRSRAHGALSESTKDMSSRIAESGTGRSELRA